ncbi:DUF6059 family protein [Kitasatospora camelliae]|uniref:DUF6059 family protein n=1 Tax=Kitasatospora camelliae TaxID=3156397 RepID=A0AAU8K0D6_9ACTN
MGRAVIEAGLIWVWVPPPPDPEPTHGPPPLHPERLRPDLPLTPTERHLAHQLRDLAGYL